MNYDLSRAIAILREAHAALSAAEAKSRPPAMADLEVLGVPTGALCVKRKSRRRKAA